MTRSHLVSEPSPFPIIAGLGAWLRITDFTLLQDHYQTYYYTSEFPLSQF